MTDRQRAEQLVGKVRGAVDKALQDTLTEEDVKLRRMGYTIAACGLSWTVRLQQVTPTLEDGPFLKACGIRVFKPKAKRAR